MTKRKFEVAFEQPQTDEQKEANLERTRDAFEDLTDEQKGTRLVEAAQSGDMEAVQRLLDGGVDPRPKMHMLMYNACKNGNADVLALLLHWKGPNGEYIKLTTNHNSHLTSAVENGHAEVVKTLLDWRGPRGGYIKLKVSCNPHLTTAVEKGHTEVVKTLLDWRGPKGEYITPTASRKPHLISAVEKGHTGVVQALLDWRGPNGEYINPPADHTRLLMSAAGKGHIGVVQALLAWKGQNGEYINPAADKKNELLMFAAEKGHAEVVQALLDWRGPNGEYINPTANQNQLITCGVRHNQTDIVKMALAWEGPNGECIRVTLGLMEDSFINYAKGKGFIEAMGLILWSNPMECVSLVNGHTETKALFEGLAKNHMDMNMLAPVIAETYVASHGGKLHAWQRHVFEEEAVKLAQSLIRQEAKRQQEGAAPSTVEPDSEGHEEAKQPQGSEAPSMMEIDSEGQGETKQPQGSEASSMMEIDTEATLLSAKESAAQIFPRRQPGSIPSLQHLATTTFAKHIAPDAARTFQDRIAESRKTTAAAKEI